MHIEKNKLKASVGAPTPLIKQYNTLKAKHPDTLLLCRVGDFYEAFGEDAKKLSEIGEIVLTKYANGSATHIPMAGFPYHALDTYLPKLLRAGLRVAISNQPKHTIHKGLIQREVVDLITPGLSYHDQVLHKKENNYLASLHFDKNLLGISFLDLSTGEFLVAEGTKNYIEKLLQSFRPAEILFNKKEKSKCYKNFGQQQAYYALEDWVYKLKYSYEKISAHFRTTTLKGFGIEKLTIGIIAAGAILHYLQETKHQHLSHINAISRLEEEKYLWLDKFTIRSLELITPQKEEGTSLIHVLDKTVTPMGGRILRKWILLPLKEIKLIQQRLDLVDSLFKAPLLMKEILHHLKQIGDLERIISKLAAKRINPRELIALKKALAHTTPIQHALEQSGIHMLKQLGQQMYNCDFLLKEISKTLSTNPPIITNQGGLIQNSVNDQLDTLRKIVFQAQDHLQNLVHQAKVKTGINSLKSGYNKIFGFYLEVTHTYKNKVPNSWIRKQTLVNAERYITQELKNHEEKILSAQEKMYALEQTIYDNLIHKAETFVPKIQSNAQYLGKLDIYHAFAQQAKAYHYVKPTINQSNLIHLKQARHPVIEYTLPIHKKYVPNDLYIDNEQQQILLITGPNMAGKSALLCQTALHVIMAQIGSFVPAQQASIGVVDKIFTRVGASDNLAVGESTFMVEMQEMASILHNITDKSLVIVDELGRGTSTADGFSLAQATIEYLHTTSAYKAKTLFATHYHALTQLAQTLHRVKNFYIAVKQIKDDILFLHTLKAGSIPNSFGIQVAKIAGMPKNLIQRAQTILADLSEKPPMHKYTILPPEPPIEKVIEQSHHIANLIKDALDKIEVDTLSPIEALLKLQELKLLVEEELS